MDIEFETVGLWNCVEIADLVEQHCAFRPEVSTREDVVTIHAVSQELTDSQKAQLAAYLRSHPQGTSEERQAERAEQDRALRDQVRQVAQSAVGVAINDLSLAQTKSLIAVMLFKEGAIGDDLRIKPLNRGPKQSIPCEWIGVQMLGLHVIATLRL